MAKKTSAGILVFRRDGGGTSVFLVHPGGPFWKGKDLGAWSIPKGEFTDEDALTAARREFREETGMDIDGNFKALTPLKQPSGKLILAWAVEGNFDHTALQSNTFSMEWPPRSGKMCSFPEVDQGGWFDLDVARQKILSGQRPFIDELQSQLD